MKLSLEQSHLVFTLLFFILVSYNIRPQGNSNNPNTIYFELGGNCILYSFNYERELLPNINSRIGISYFSLKKVSNSGPGTSARLITLFMLSYNISLFGNNNIEIGGGVISILNYESFYALDIGYKYSPIDGGLFFKISYTPILDSKYFDSQAWFGIGIGYKF